MNNQLAKQEKKPSFGVMINSTGYKTLINRTLGDPKKATRFVIAISSAVATNPALQECDAATIVSAGLLGETLNLSPSPQLGQYYLVPFNDRKNNRTTAQFQLGYRGMLQLAQRSGEYKRINAMAVKEGELIRYDAFMDEIELKYIEDEEQRQSLPTIGYFAMFEYHNGFRKVLYWSKAKMEQHALTYSQGYRAKKGYTFWEKDFDAMGIKTMLRQLLSKWGMMSLEMQKAYEADGGVLNQDGSIDYVDTVEAAPQPEPQPEPVPVTAEIVQEAPQQPDPIPEPPMPDEPPFVDDDDFASLMG
ncbi:MAG: recombinase RecT [Oscillospiraceae bacterium]|nr:recombinase RecT [Oscillospiraceae bacterium]